LIRVWRAEIHLVILQNAIKNAQDLVRQYNKKNISLKDALFTIRKDAAEDES